MTARHAPEKLTRARRSRTTPTTTAVDDRLDDAAVVARSLRDPDQFAAIYDRYFAQVYRYVAGRLGRNVADDLAAETFLVAFRKRGRFDPALGPVRPWLYGIATIVVGQHRREETRKDRALARPAGGRSGRSRVTTTESTQSRPSGTLGA